MKEHAACGFARGMTELLQTLDRQTRRAMPRELFDRFTGLAQVRATLANKPMLCDGGRVAIVDEGKNACVVRQALNEIGADVTDDARQADTLMIGTLSPGPMLDALHRRLGDGTRPVLPPWHPLPIPTDAAAGPVQQIVTSIDAN
jgi:hypothetical protein